jgi:hypothetical protein
MGIDLRSIRSETGRAIILSYNWSGWGWLVDFLNQLGVDTSEFRFHNDGEVIAASTCVKVADALEKHFDQLKPEDQSWLEGHAESWRCCGGFEQW